MNPFKQSESHNELTREADRHRAQWSRRTALRRGAQAVVLAAVPWAPEGWRGHACGHSEPNAGGEPEPACAARSTREALSSQELNIWLELRQDNSFRLYIPKAEMGQGVLTCYAMIAAEELGVRLDQLRVELAPATPELTDPRIGLSVTGGSTSVRGQFERLRQAGAAARDRILRAAARKLSTSAQSLAWDEAQIIDARSGKVFRAVDFIDEIADTPVSSGPLPLKPERDFVVLGKDTPALDAAAKVQGQIVYGHDVSFDGLRVASVRLAPVFGGQLGNLEALRGAFPLYAENLFSVDGGVAAVAPAGGGFWEAEQMLSSIGPAIVFTAPAVAAEFGESTLRQLLAAALGADRPEAEVRRTGDPEARFLAADRRVEATYHVPFVPHMCMETMTCTVRLQRSGAGIERAELWVPTQSPRAVIELAARVLNKRESEITVHSTHLGGGFGRKAQTDCVLQALQIALQIEEPVKLIWSREQDTTHDFYRPAFAARCVAALSAEGSVDVVMARNAGPSIFEALGIPRRGVDPTSVDAFADNPYAFPHELYTHQSLRVPVPIGFWRSVGASQNAFFIESFVDELAHATGTDPIVFRRRLISSAGSESERSRLLRVLKAVEDLSEWGLQDRSSGRSKGVALVKSFGTIVAQVAEVSVSRRKDITVHRVWCVVDCGRALNPLHLRAQMESGIVFGLSAALAQKVTVESGACQESNFDSAPVLFPSQMPEVVTEIINSGAPLGGVGEPGTPPIAPAVANAVFRLTGDRLRELPLRLPG